MKKSKITDKKKKKVAAPEAINVFWDINPNWHKLTFEQKSEFYWKYHWVSGKRVFMVEVG